MRFLIFVSFFLVSSVFAETFKGFEILKNETHPIILVAPSKLCPTQTAIGQMTVNALLNERFGEKAFTKLGFVWDKNQNLESNMKKLKEDELKKYISSIQANIEKNIFDGAYFSGGVFHFDGHHRSRAYYEINLILEKISSDPKLRLFVPVRILSDYSSPPLKDKEIAVDLFITKRQGYVPSSLFKSNKPEELALMKYLYLRTEAPNIASLKDDPYRSLIGQALYEEKVEGDDFVTYFEFYLEEFFKSSIDQALLPEVIKPNMTITPAMVEKVKKVLFSKRNKVDQIAYWARFENLNKDEAYKRCLLKKEEICKRNKKKFESLWQKYK